VLLWRKPPFEKDEMFESTGITSLRSVIPDAFMEKTTLRKT
jgi:hypothetical protein